MINVIKEEIKRHIDMMDRKDVFFLRRILISLQEYVKERNGDVE